MPLLRPKGHFWRLCPALTPQGGARPPTHHSNFHPYLRAVIVGGVEMAASLPVVISCSGPLAPTCPLHSSGGHWGASVCGGSPTVGGPRHIPTSAPGYTHGSHPRCRGSMRLLGKPSPV
ncbi:hypothetical protein GWK47_023549 [Chionoecetes opilio]|uniref:Uncharacterized protein n=1 Tax=Chionoecetes opilio TaxID=41210 RepID=A0A8J5CGD6_CHIOP|nr:hypothetical protein GWK47_023549 [Chionoecetes opilio]